MSLARADAAVRKGVETEVMRNDKVFIYEAQVIQGKPEYIYFYELNILRSTLIHQEIT
jgi:hypothetical protein